MSNNTDHETILKINNIFQSILGNTEELDNNSATIDSVAYVELLIAFQNEFKIKFTTQEFFSLRDVKKIRESVQTKILK